ncbi:MAG: hypothetical protein MJZ28_10220 [Paludibacteraceae bacterium]|nr:hypothetical protein [Paludibacteraceae bacterium]
MRQEYEEPAIEVIEIESEGVILATSITIDSFESNGGFEFDHQGFLDV